MAEYIEREAAIEAVEAQCVDGKMYGRDDGEGTLVDAYDIIDAISDAPAADVVEVRHGRWIVFNDGTEESPQRDHMRCSVCGWYWSIPEHRTVFSYCPNCGAKMDGGNRNGTD